MNDVVESLSFSLIFEFLKSVKYFLAFKWVEHLGQLQPIKKLIYNIGGKSKLHRHEVWAFN